LTSLEIVKAYHYWNSYDHINGLFEAPVDGLYQFHMSCDDSCTFYIGSGGDPTDPASKVEVLKQHHYTYYRQYQNKESDVNSENFDDYFYSQWMNLTGGQLYYIETRLGQGAGEVHLTVGVEINPVTPIPDHPMQRSQQQSFKIAQDEANVKFDTTKIILTDAANWSGTYTLALAKPANN
jgi:hypothetical protein